jgi:metal-responsive CopG/Arc/MetJ family transcriptional regulator
VNRWFGYTFGMKTAISVPDDVFSEVDAQAKKLGMSRSEFYVRAAVKELRAMSSEEVTAQLNAVYDEIDSSLDPALRVAQQKTLQASGW